MIAPMKERIYLLFILLIFSLIPTLLFSQEATFAISEVDTSNFPYIRCTFIALDGTGQSYKNLSPADFDVYERGKNMNASVTVDCKDTIIEPAVSIVLVVDQSQSMNDTNEAGEKRWDWVRIGVKAFVNEINFKSGTKVALISFGKFAYLRCNFTDNKDQLIDSLERTWVGGGTEYDPPFLDRNNGAIQLFTNYSPDPKKRRIIVFLTDGEPNNPPKTDSIIRELQRTNIQVYAITLAMPMNKDLDKISSQTGGKAYRVNTKDDLVNIYRFIALDIQRKQLCFLNWISEFPCDESDLERTIRITFKRQGVTIERIYVVPKRMIALLPNHNEIYDFGDPAPNQYNEVDIPITAVLSDYYVNGVNIIPSTFYQVVNWDVGGSGGPPPFTIAKGETRTIRVRFTQGAMRSYREATLYIDAKPCPAQMRLIGGISQVRIITPNGGEIYSVCDTVLIRWSGVEITKPVNLFYSSDGGNTWKSIANNVRGLSYKWVPPAGGNRFRIKATVAPVADYVWLKGIGGTEDDYGTSIAVTDDNSYFYVTGYFSGTIDFGNNVKKTSAGSVDFFIAKYDRDGNLVWAQTGGGFGVDSAAGVCVDKQGNAYVVGTCFQTASFGYITPSMPVANVPYCFIAKYPASGSNPIVTLIGANETYNTFRAWGQKIKFRPTGTGSDEIVILGEYVGQIQTPVYSLPRVTTPSMFTAVLNPDMSIKLVQKGGVDDGTYSKAVAYDGIGDRYEVGTFQGTLKSGNFQITSKGGKDAFIRRYGGSPGSEDISDADFSIQNPVWSAKYSNVVFPETTLGTTSDTIVASLICNNGNVPITVRNFGFIGQNSSDFLLGQNIIGERIEPGKCINLELRFKPTDLGPRYGQLVVYPDCGTEVVVNLEGVGVCSGESLPLVSCGASNLSVKIDTTVLCIFKNPNPASLPVKFVISGPNSSDFSIPVTSRVVKPDECVDLTISFTPTGAGVRTAYLKFELPTGCESPVTELRGLGVDADILVRSIDWDGRRILTRNDSTLVIVNRSSINQKLIDIKFETPTDNFKFANDTVISLPVVIPTNDSISIPIYFYPEEETTYSSTLIFKFEGLLSDLTANLRGEGTLPRIELKWTCLDAVKPGDQGLAELEVSNPSTTQDLYIYSMDFKYKTGDFNWKNGVPKDIIIPKNSQRTFEVIFTPKTPGTRGDLINIIHDAGPGPEKYPRLDTLFEAECDGLGLTTISSFDFGNSLICEENIHNIAINNDSWITPISIIGYEFTNSDSVAFSINENLPIVIPPSNFYTISVKFKPSEKKKYSTTLRLYTSINTTLDIELAGEGVYVDFYSDQPEMKLLPGFNRRTNLKAKLPKTFNGDISELNFTISYDNKMLRIDTILFNNISGWTWNPYQTLQPGLVNVSGYGRINTPFDLELLTLDFTVFLSDKQQSLISVELQNKECKQSWDDVTKIIISGVCYVGGRLVIVSDKTYNLLGPEINPVDRDTEILFSTAFDDLVVLELFNSFGQKVKTLTEQKLPAGIHSLPFSVYDLPNGVYYIRMKAGTYISTVSLVITK